MNQPNPAQQASDVELPLPKLPKPAFLSLHASYYSEAQLVVLMRHAQQIAWEAARELTAVQGVEHGEDAPQFPLPGAEPKWSEDIGCVIHELRAGRPELALKRALHIQSLADAAQENQ